MARTVLQLGAELIGSDGIAFFELIKNAFDAGSPRVDIDVVVRLPYDSYVSHSSAIETERRANRTAAATQQALTERKAAISIDLDSTAPGTPTLATQVTKATTWDELLDVLDAANYIDFRDTGSGMTRADLDNKFLTIGTRSRLLEVEQQARGGKGSDRPILGEKGLGRLSAMRLGWRLLVETSTPGEANWNVLTINWRLFSHESDDLVDDVVIKPATGGPKSAKQASGTLIRVSGLRTQWSADILRAIASAEFSRLTDPFTPKSRYPISLRFNDEPLPIPELDKTLFAKAQAVVRAKYEITDGGPRFTGSVEYKERKQSFSLDLPHLVSITKCKPALLSALGPFSVEFYWYNRRILEAVEGIGDKRAVQQLVNRWSGGLMVFRDGFRVNPYGSSDDDWLDLDHKALASGGYKINRKQLIGRVCISRLNNPALADQSNREGIRDSDEKRALVGLLQNLIESGLRGFLNKVDAELSPRLPVGFDDLSERIEAESTQLRRGVDLLMRKYPAIRKDAEFVNALDSSFHRIDELLSEAQELADSFKQGRTQLVDLAGLGLMVEILAHELNRAAQHALSTLADTDSKDLAPGLGSRLTTLKAQLKTLQKRLGILDPLSQTSRQVKESFDLVAWIEEIVSSHEAQFRRHGIKCSVTVAPSRPASGLVVRMVKGMIVQIMENLLSNSVYWLKQQRRLDSHFTPKISIVIDSKAKEIRVTDNGPGIPRERIEDVFQPFMTTKPPREGKGLGLYISREIAHSQGSSLVLSKESSNQDNRLNTFVLSLGAAKT